MNFGTVAKQVLAAVAPLIGGALGGPFGGAAGVILQKALSTSDPKNIEAAITSGDPDILVKLKEADNDFRVQMEQLGVSQDQIAASERASARAREIAVKDATPHVLAFLLTLGFFAVLGYLIAFGKPNQGGDAMLLLLGALSASFTGVIQYYFGSSSGSAAKSDTLAKIVSNNK